MQFQALFLSEKVIFERSKFMRILYFYIIISAGFFLCPGPSFWYGLMNSLEMHQESLLHFFFLKMQLFMISVEENHEIKALSAHFILMAICAFYSGQIISKFFLGDTLNKLKITFL